MKVTSFNHLISGVVCADYSDERDRLLVKDNGLPRPTSFCRFVDDPRPVLLIVWYVDVVAVAATVTVPQQQPDTQTNNYYLHRAKNYEKNEETDWHLLVNFCPVQVSFADHR